jgi:hypothetical protein
VWQQHVAQGGGAGQLRLSTWPARVAQRKTEEEGAGGRRWGLMCNSPKAQGLHYKA